MGGTIIKATEWWRNSQRELISINAKFLKEECQKKRKSWEKRQDSSNKEKLNEYARSRSHEIRKNRAKVILAMSDCVGPIESNSEFFAPFPHCKKSPRFHESYLLELIEEGFAVPNIGKKSWKASEECTEWSRDYIRENRKRIRCLFEFTNSALNILGMMDCK